jgi:hypothetical protein
VRVDRDGRWIVIRRAEVTVVANLAPDPGTVPIGSAPHTLAVATDSAARLDAEGAVVTLPPLSAVVLEERR